MSIATGLSEVKERIRAAERAAGRPEGSVKLMAVSKLKPASALREAYAAGQRDFGENYVQEMVEKAAELADLADLRLHLIGNLQSNKARIAAGVATSVHTVDSPKIARELGKRALAHGRSLPVFIEVNVGGEEQKHGCAPDDLDAVIASIRAEPSLVLEGLMTVPPHTDDPAGARPFFAKLRALQEAHGGPSALRELSMGMSHDLEAAVLEGATIVRIGTAIFGARG